MYKIIKIITTLILSVAVIILFVVNHQAKEKVDKLESYKKTIQIPKKKEYSSGLSAKEVAEYNNLLKSKIDDFKKYKLSEGVLDESNTGVQVIRTKLTPRGGKIITKNTSKKEFMDYYNNAKYELSNVSAEKDDKGNVEVFANIKVEFAKYEIGEMYDLISITFNEDGEITGGKIYGKL